MNHYLNSARAFRSQGPGWLASWGGAGSPMSKPLPVHIASLGRLRCAVPGRRWLAGWRLCRGGFSRRGRSGAHGTMATPGPNAATRAAPNPPNREARHFDSTTWRTSRLRSNVPACPPRRRQLPCCCCPRHLWAARPRSPCWHACILYR